MIVAVTGADGFIGRHTCLALVEGGHEVRPLTRSRTATGPDLADPGADWASVLGGCDVLVNLAGLAHDVRRHTEDQAGAYMAINAQGAARVAKAAARAGARRVIQVSTIKVLGEQPHDGVRFREQDPLAPLGVYARSKAEGERLVREAVAGSSTEAVIVRLPLVFGQPFKGNLALMERAIRRGVLLPLGHHSIGARTYVKVEDLGELLVRVVEHPGPLPQTLHARSSPDLTAGEVARMVGSRIGRQPRLVAVPASVMAGSARLMGRPEYAAKICDEMLVSDELTRVALGLDQVR